MKKFLSLLGVAALVLVGCQKSEKERFIDARSESTCMVFENPDLASATVDDIKEKTIEIFKDNGFEAENEEAMKAIMAKYEEDKEVAAEIEKAFQECAGDLLKAFEGLSGEGEVIEETVKGETETK